MFEFVSPEELEGAKNHYMMRVHENLQEMDDFFDRLPVNDLKLVRDIVRTVLADQAQGHYLVGYLSQFMRMKHDVCQFCGDAHETPEAFLKAHTHTGNVPEGRMVVQTDEGSEVVDEQPFVGNLDTDPEQQTLFDHAPLWEGDMPTHEDAPDPEENP